MARLVEVRVSFSRQANDGNYGSETARCELVLEAAADELIIDADAGQLLDQARATVHAQLAKSPNWSVRRAVEQPKPALEEDRSSLEDEREDLGIPEEDPADVPL